MKYVGIQTQIWKNNRNSLILLGLFPIIILGMVLFFILVMDYFNVLCSFNTVICIGDATTYGNIHWSYVWELFFAVLPYVIGIVTIWFIIAYMANTSIIRFATHAKPVERKDNLRVYNIVENLCIAGGIEMPQINIIEDNKLNAFASGIDIPSFTITLTRGLIEKLNDAELAAVIGHELTHIKNRDTRLMVVCIVFVGIIGTLQTLCIKMISLMIQSLGSSSYRKNRKNNGGGLFFVIFGVLVALVITSIAYFFSTLTRLAISRKREYMADAGGAELCGDPLALASALKKVSKESGLGNIKRSDIAQLYIIHPDEEYDEPLTGWIAKANLIFQTHPETRERIRILEQF